MTRPIEILLIEDNPGDVRLTIEALREGKILHDLAVAADGVEALARLRREGTFAAAQRPDLIFLDLKLPKKDGMEVLSEIKRDEKLRSIPVVVLTSSASEQDVLQAYELRANCYVVKPLDQTQLMQVMRSIEEFWLTIVKLPRGS